MTLMALPRVRSGSDWSDEIAEAIREEFNGEVEVRKPGTPGEYDPTTGKYADEVPGEVILERRPARAQHVRQPGSSNDGNSWQTSRHYRFQCDIRPDDASITKGLIVRFFGGRDPEIPKMIFHVQWATNSSHAAIRTIECLTEGARDG